MAINLIDKYLDAESVLFELNGSEFLEDLIGASAERPDVLSKAKRVVQRFRSG